VIVVSDATPLIVFAAIGRFGLLADLYGELTVPEAVYSEVAVRGAGRPGAAEVSSAAWVKRAWVADRALVARLAAGLGTGEAEAIACALERSARLLLLDEEVGRKVAVGCGLSVRGSVGVLLEAKRRALVPTVRPPLDELRTQGGLFVSDALYARVLQAAGE
jgi:predicted nucleic acid-binding protein